MRTLALALLAAVVAQADDKKVPTLPTGSWTHEAEGFEIRFTFKKEELKITAKNGENSAAVTCKCEIDKEGMIKATITEVKTKGELPGAPKADNVLNFKFTVDGKKAKLSDFKSADLDHAKAVLEGDYESKSD